MLVLCALRKRHHELGHCAVKGKFLQPMHETDSRHMLTKTGKRQVVLQKGSGGLHLLRLHGPIVRGLI